MSDLKSHFIFAGYKFNVFLYIFLEFLCQAFSALSENDVVSPETFFKWKDCADPVEHAGKGVAINATCHFFTMLTENDD